MSPGRLVFFLSVCALGLLWSFVVFTVDVTRFEYRNLIASIRAGEQPPSRRALADAITAYGSTLHIASCSAALHQDMALLLGARTDAAMSSGTVDEDAQLQQTQEELAASLSCKPTDGKAWLDFATIDIYREGFTPRALNAYRMSALVAPGESWLAEKRLLFALQFRPLFDANAMKIAKEDLAVLKRAHPNRMHDVMKVVDIGDEASLYAVFGARPQQE